MLLDKILILIIVQKVAVDFGFSLQCVRVSTELGENSDGSGGRLMVWQEGFFDGVSGIGFIFYSAVVPVRERLS